MSCLCKSSWWWILDSKTQWLSLKPWLLEATWGQGGCRPDPGAWSHKQHDCMWRQELEFQQKLSWSLMTNAKPQQLILFLCCQIHVKFMFHFYDIKPTVHGAFEIHCCTGEAKGQEAMFWQSQRHVAQLSLRNESTYEHARAVHQPMGQLCLLCNRYSLKQDFSRETRQAGGGLTQCPSGCGMMYLCFTITPVVMELKGALEKKSKPHSN